MPNPSFSIKVAFVLSLSLAAAATATSSSSPSFAFLKRPVKLKIKPTSASLSSPSGPTLPKATTSDLLALLGPPNQASSVNSQVAQQLTSCFKFLVPFSPHPGQLATHSVTRRPLDSNPLTGGRTTTIKRSREEENELVWWPPAPVMELARLALDSGADPGSVHRALDPTPITVPDVEGSKKDQCQLTRTSYGWRFVDEELNSYLEFLFEIILDRGPSVGLNVSLSRYDLFHGHLFIAADSGRLGILFHAKEYPAYDKEVFPYNMGYCQRGSNVKYDDAMNLRNILWLAPLPSNSTERWLTPGVLVVLDAHPGGIIFRDLIPDYVQFARTLYEDNFGEVVVDVNYLNTGGQAPEYQIFIC